MLRTPSYPFRSEPAKSEYEAHGRERAKNWPVPCETRVLETRTGSTFVRVSGSSADPPLVLLPGARVSSLMWRHAIDILAAHHRTYALDIPGDAGFSVNDADIGSYDDWVSWLDEVLGLLVPPGIPVKLVGVSLGGAIAARYACSFPRRVSHLVLIAPGATVLRFSIGFFVRFALLSLPIRRLGRSPLRRTCEWLFEDAMRGDAACRSRAEEAIHDVQLVVRVFGLRPPPWPGKLTDLQWRSLDVPCLFLVGEREKIYSARAAVRRLQRVAPRVTAEIIPGAGHDHTIVKPRAVAERVTAFLQA